MPNAPNFLAHHEMRAHLAKTSQPICMMPHSHRYPVQGPDDNEGEEEGMMQHAMHVAFLTDWQRHVRLCKPSYKFAISESVQPPPTPNPHR